MAGNVIDLLSSSSPGPSLPPAAKTISKADGKPLRVSAPPARASYQAPKKTNGDCITIISSDEDDPFRPDASKDTKSGRTVSLPNLKPSRTSKPTAKPEEHAGFFFLSDDIDSTVNVHKSFAQIEPSAKRQRLSSSPQPELPKRRERAFARSISNIESSKTKPARGGPLPASKKSNTTDLALEHDPLVFTSSPDPFAEISRRRKERRRGWEDSNDEDIFGFSTPGANQDGKKYANLGPGKPKSGRDTLDDFGKDYSSDDLPDLASLPNMAPNPYTSSHVALAKYEASKIAEKRGTKGKGKPSSDKIQERAKTAEEKAKEKLRITEERIAAKEVEKRRKGKEREDKARKKLMETELAKVNLLRTEKKETAKEMIIEMSSAIEEVLTAQVQSFARPLEMRCDLWESSLPVVKWKRKWIAQWNEKKDHWEPIPETIKPENNIIYVISAQEMVDLICSDETRNLDSNVLRIKTKFPSCQVIYMIEGLRAWLRKNETVKNRQFKAAVNSHLNQGELNNTATNRKKKDPEYVDEDIIEDALLKLQVVDNALIYHTSAKIDTAEWIIAFSQQLSLTPYRNQMNGLDTTFCMEPGQIKSGDSPADTFTKMLQELARITIPIALGIASKYPSVQLLVKGLEENGPLALEDLKKCANSNGAVTDQRVGPAISKRIYKVFMGTDPDSWEV